MGPWPQYLYKARRDGPTDYLCDFDHEDFERARHSVLWQGEWARQTTQVLGVMQELGLVRDGLHVLDYGCGVGRMSEALLARSSLRIVGADRSAVMLRHARTYLAPQLEKGAITLCSDADFLATPPDAVFDLVMLVEVAQHIPEPILEQLLPSLARRLRPGGHLFIYGNYLLDVDAAGHICKSRVQDVVARTLNVVRADHWSFNPHTRHSFLCTAPK